MSTCRHSPSPIKWNTETRNLKVDDVVIIVDANAQRGLWPLARVAEILPGDDGRVRVVKLVTRNGSLTRPASQVCLLEESLPPMKG